MFGSKSYFILYMGPTRLPHSLSSAWFPISHSLSAQSRELTLPLRSLPPGGRSLLPWADRCRGGAPTCACSSWRASRRQKDTPARVVAPDRAAAMIEPRSACWSSRRAARRAAPRCTRALRRLSRRWGPRRGRRRTADVRRRQHE
jgi:hypothetical protein